MRRLEELIEEQDLQDIDITQYTRERRRHRCRIDT